MTCGGEAGQATREKVVAPFPVWLVAAGTQFAAWVLVSLVPGTAMLHEGTLQWLIQAAAAAAIGHACGLAWWWAPINAGFVIALRAAPQLSVGPGWYLAGFLITASVFGAIHRTRVPLYLSGPGACRALSALLPHDRQFRLLDAGCGVGTILAYLAARFPKAHLEGVELALVPWLLGWLRSRLTGGFRCRRGDLWEQDLSRYDVVYAFLSPLPMSDLWKKVELEMRPGSVFVSNSFAVDGVAPSEVIPLRGAGRNLYVWRR